MAIEISDSKVEYTYRVNPFQPNCLDRKRNRHGARWEHWQKCNTASEAVAALLELQRKERRQAK